MTPRRVTFFSAYPHVYGGGEHAVLLLARGLQGRGWETEVIVPAEGPTAERLRDAGVPVRVVVAPVGLSRFGGSTRPLGAMASLPRYWRRLARALRGASVVQTYAHRGALLAGPAARLARVPLVWNVVGIEPSRAVAALGAGMASVTAPVSVSVQRSLTGLAGRRRSVVVPNGVDVDPAFVAEPGAAPLVACVARLTPEKGVDVLLRAVALLAARQPDVRLLVVGPEQRGHEGYGDGLRALAGELGIEEIVDFTGAVDDPSSHWRPAWVYAQPSRTEGFGLAAVEAMAAGVPVVASDVGGLGEVIEAERTGLLVAPDDPATLASALERLIVDRDLAARLGAAGRAEALAAYGLEQMLDRYEELYAGIAPAAGSGRRARRRRA